jgi:Flp pilus assembly protein TadG
MKISELRKFRADDGATIVEFGLVAVMFVVVLLGVVDMGRMVLVYTTLAQAARAGARYAIVHGADRTGAGPNGPSGPAANPIQVVTVVKNFASAGPLNPAGLGTPAVFYVDGTNTVGSKVRVTVTYTYDPLVSYYNSLLNVTMSSTSEGIIVF